ncbi:MAG: flap endonuclease-1 [Candidatus Methanofastidiosa archaeon]|nr:flap endonuclease-1 [Candidatus Methanofastidiosa archaeon]
MGVDLKDIIAKNEIELAKLNGKAISVDALNALYQFLAIIRQRDGELLKDSTGRTTSHLSGLFYRTINLLELGIRPVYIYDGRPPQEKIDTLRQRQEIKDSAKKKAIRAKVEGREKDYVKFSQQVLHFSDEMLKESKELLRLMGVPFIDAPSEAEAQASHMCSMDPRVYAVASQDYDSLLFGAPVLVRNVTITGRRKMPGKNVYREVVPESIVLAEALAALGIGREGLVEIGLLIGTDYNEGIKGIGPKSALEIVKADRFDEYGIEERLKDLFLKPDVSDNFSFSFKLPDEDALYSFLCDEREFSRLRVERAMDRLKKGIEGVTRQETLDQWF